MQVSPAGLDLIKRFESLRLKAYYCPAGVLTIGYGHTDPEVRIGQTMHPDAAEYLLELDATKASRALKGLRLTQNQFDALVSFVFNLGAGAFRTSTIRRLLVDGLYGQAADQFPRWVHAGGRKLAGLVIRRDAERTLFLTP
jgi:lysozyme